jgi:TetR/AcrR family transcriptional repressor of nem operon
MARTRAFDDETVVLAARELFWDHGYAGTSLVQLEQATGLNKSSLYATYGSKRGLFERAVRSYVTEVVEPLLGAMEAPDAGVGTIAAFFLGMSACVGTVETRFAGRGCLLVNTAMELEHLDEAAAAMAVGFRERIASAIGNALGHVEAVTDPHERAQFLTATYLGIMVTARLDPAAAAVASEAVAHTVRGW